MAIKDFKGGVFMIGHNAEFYEALVLKNDSESGRLTVMGAEWMEEVEKPGKSRKIGSKAIKL